MRDNQRLGLRWQSGLPRRSKAKTRAATPLSPAPDAGQVTKGLGPDESGVALRFPPQPSEIRNLNDEWLMQGARGIILMLIVNFVVD
jgi:hypothetical protein